jgi:hypothetical protein
MDFTSTLLLFLLFLFIVIFWHDVKGAVKGETEAVYSRLLSIKIAAIMPLKT